ncbi:MAG: hypothetical protein HZA90_28520 [Verrucomicrobia bacterium]|nr:hypothetical protein [Verrucomicrobiota bacterium]
MPIYVEDESLRRRLQIIVGALGGGIVVLMLLGFWLGQPAYRHHKEKRFLAQAQEFLRTGDYKEAALSARLALNLNPTNVEACRIVVQLLEVARSPEVVLWLQRIVALEPGVFQNRLHLVKAAFAHGDVARARQALEGAAESDRPTAAYHEMAALLALATNQVAASGSHLEEAAKLDPENKRLQLNLAVLNLQARNTEKADAAQQSLEKLSTDEKFRLDALRVLANGALRNHDLTGALARTRLLVADPAASFEDRLLHLTLLAQAQSPELTNFLASVQEAVKTTPAHIYGLSGWMLARRPPEEVLKWLASLPTEARQQPPVLLAVAEAHIAQGNWTGLGSLLAEQRWGDLEFVRAAFQARVVFENKDVAAQKVFWQRAVNEAGDRLRSCTALVQMASAWRWADEQESLLRLISQRFPKERWPLKELDRLYAQNGNTPGLLRVYTALLQLDPKDITVKNNLAAVSLLLTQNLSQAQTFAREAYEARPQDPVVCSTYAHALHLSGKTHDGLEVLERLTPPQLQTPAIAAYYGVLLTASGQTNKARPYLEAGRRAKLLPEETALVRAALGAP